jgi:hypothetical protein
MKTHYKKLGLYIEVGREYLQALEKQLGLRRVEIKVSR